MISIARTFGAPETVPAGKHAFSASKLDAFSLSFPLHFRDEMHDVRKSLQAFEDRNLDTPEFAHTSNIVTPDQPASRVLLIPLIGEKFFSQ